MALYVCLPDSNMDKLLNKQAPFPWLLWKITGGFFRIVPIPSTETWWSFMFRTRLNFKPAIQCWSSLSGWNFMSGPWWLSTKVTSCSSSSSSSNKLSTISIGTSFTFRSLPHGFSHMVSQPTSMVADSSDDKGISVLDIMTICDLIGVEVWTSDVLLSGMTCWQFSSNDCTSPSQSDEATCTIFPCLSTLYIFFMELNKLARWDTTS